jgi:peptide/nickel transport system substrate-binding protein
VRRSSGRSRRTVFGFAAALLALGLVAAACGSDDSSSGSGTTAGGGAGTTASGGAGTTAASTAEPVPGGKLVVGIEADTGSPWTPAKMLCAVSCYQTVGSVYDPLVLVNADGQPVPYLAESVEPNADFTVWTIKARAGVTFHDGTPLDGAAVEFNMESCQYSSLTGAAYLWVEDISSSGQTVTIKTKAPYAAMPRQFTERQCAYMFSPTWLKSLEDIPQRNANLAIYDASLAAPTGDPSKPVGLGAYKFQSYTPGNGNSFKLVRNDDYWRGPKAPSRRSPRASSATPATSC